MSSSWLRFLFVYGPDPAALSLFLWLAFERLPLLGDRAASSAVPVPAVGTPIAGLSSTWSIRVGSFPAG